MEDATSKTETGSNYHTLNGGITMVELDSREWDRVKADVARLTESNAKLRTELGSRTTECEKLAKQLQVAKEEAEHARSEATRREMNSANAARWVAEGGELEQRLHATVERAEGAEMQHSLLRLSLIESMSLQDSVADEDIVLAVQTLARPGHLPAESDDVALLKESNNQLGSALAKQAEISCLQSEMLRDVVRGAMR